MKIAIIGGLITLLLCGAGCDTPKCIKSHQKEIKHPAYNQMIKSGKTTRIYRRPAQTTYQTVCDQYEK